MKPLRFGSVCSGIEAATVAMSPLGMEPEWYSEIDPFCCELLKQKYPGVPNLGDITKIKKPPQVDLVVGGTPCQSFSVQGERQGLDDARGNLSLHFARLVGQARARWFIWENVPGVLSANKGRDFGTIIRALEQRGYGWAYRTLDIRGFGIPHRRRRVFVVGHTDGDWRRAAAVLFNRPACCDSHSPPDEVSGGESGSKAYAAAQAARVIGWSGDETPKHGIECVPTLRSFQGGEGVGVIGEKVFRKLRMTEWERLQGFPDGYTKITYKGKPAGPGVRKVALGNSFCVNIIRWLAERIQLSEEIYDEKIA